MRYYMCNDASSNSGWIGYGNESQREATHCATASINAHTDIQQIGYYRCNGPSSNTETNRVYKRLGKHDVRCSTACQCTARRYYPRLSDSWNANATDDSHSRSTVKTLPDETRRYLMAWLVRAPQYNFLGEWSNPFKTASNPEPLHSSAVITSLIVN